MSCSNYFLIMSKDFGNIKKISVDTCECFFLGFSPFLNRFLKKNVINKLCDEAFRCYRKYFIWGAQICDRERLMAHYITYTY